MALANLQNRMAKSVVEDVPQLKRGQVWCVTCGATFKIDAAKCLSKGWPKCCDQTMTIDSPEERARFNHSRS